MSEVSVPCIQLIPFSEGVPPRIQAIRSQPTVEQAKEMQTLYGLRASANSPMLDIRVKLYLQASGY